MDRLAWIFGGCLALALAPAPARAACEDPGGVCVDGGAKWTADASMSLKQRAKEHKKNRKKEKVLVTFVVEGGRGSAFVDGRYHAPDRPYELSPGKHDVHLRDGDAVLAQGVLTVPKKAASITVTVVHR
jgi:hypothetical protein